MNSFESQLNELLVSTYRSIEIMEEQMVKNSKDWDLTISEMHLLEAVGPPQKNLPGKTISELSEYLSISLPSVTLAINKLVNKGYVVKQKSSTDGRVVYVSLTRAGQKAEHAHRFFHRSMVSSISKTLTEEEKQAMMSGIQKMNDFFSKSIEKNAERLVTE